MITVKGVFALVKWNYCPCGFDTNLGKHSLKLVLLAVTKDQLC